MLNEHQRLAIRKAEERLEGIWTDLEYGGCPAEPALKRTLGVLTVLFSELHSWDDPENDEAPAPKGGQ